MEVEEWAWDERRGKEHRIMEGEHPEKARKGRQVVALFPKKNTEHLSDDGILAINKNPKSHR